MIKISDSDKIEIIENLMSLVEYNFPFDETDINLFCCEVARRFMCKMKFEGSYCCFNNDLEFNFQHIGYNTIESMRLSTNEHVVLIAKKEDDIGVQDVFTFSGADTFVKADDYFTSRAVEKIIEWHNLGYKVINIHNHPFSISALPSLEDINNFDNFKSEEWKKCEDKYDIKLPDNFSFCDFLIVTKFDTFSFNINKERLPNIKKYVQIYKEELYNTPKFSEDELLIWDPVYEIGVTPESILNGLKIYYFKEA